MKGLTVGSWSIDESTDVIIRGDEMRKLERRTMATLSYLAGRPNVVVSKDELLDAIWPNVFVSEQSVATVISDLRKALGDNTRDPRYIETIAKRGYRLIAPVASESGAPVTQVIPAVRRTLSHRVLAAAFAICAGLVLLTGWIQFGRPVAVGGSKPIAVQDFVNDSSDPALDHLPFALTDIVSSTLASSTDAPVRRVKGFDGSSSRGVLVTGRLVRDGTDLVLLIQALEVPDQEVVWSREYVVDRERFSARSREVARDVAAALGIEAPEMLQAPQVRPDLFEQYWRARFLWEQRDTQSIRTAREILERLIAREPRWAQPYAALADIYAHKSGEELELPRLNTFERAQSLLDQATSLGPETSEGNVTRAVIAFYRDRNLSEARRAADRAIDLDSDSSSAWQTLAMVESGAGNHDASIRAMRRAFDLNPASPGIVWDYSWHLYLAGRYQEALVQARNVGRMGRSNSLLEALIYAGAGKDEESFRAWLARAGEAGVPKSELRAIASVRDRPLAYQQLAGAVERSANPSRPVIVALLLTKAGDVSGARLRLTTSASNNDWMAIWAPQIPGLPKTQAS